MINPCVRYGLLALFLILISCSCQKAKSDEVLIEVPNGFTGEVRIDMGVRGAPVLKQEGRSYVVSLPSDGHIETSTILVGVRPRFRDAVSGRVWGYAPSVWKTGDGIPVGGNIEFFVGTHEQYEAQEAKKHKSQFPEQETVSVGG
jgi:hypothetical protein